MATVKLHTLGVRIVPPENFVCIALQPEGQEKVVPIWTAGPEALVAAAFFKEWDDGKRRAIDVLLEVLDSLGGVTTVEIVSHHEGAFIFDVTAQNGLTVEMAATDAVVVAHHFGVDITIDEDKLAQVAIYATPEDLEEYLGVALITPAADEEKDGDDGALPTSASGDAQADADFEAMMRRMWEGGDDLPDTREEN